MSRHILIGGTGRCGTNVLRQVLDTHPMVGSLPFEYRFTIDPDGLVDYFTIMTEAWSPFVSDLKLKRLRDFLLKLSVKGPSHTDYAGWELQNWFPNYTNEVHELIANIQSFQYKGRWPGSVSRANELLDFASYMNEKILAEELGKFVSRNIDSFLEKKNKSIFIEDNTWNILFASQLKLFLPHSKLLHVIRDPRDVIASFLNQSWCPNTFENAMRMYKSLIDRWFKIEEGLSPAFYSYVKLENLILNPVQELHKIFEFTDIPSSNLLEYSYLDSRNIGKYKSILTQSNIEVINEQLAYVFIKFGYKI